MMGTVRFFSGSRYGGKRSPASELMRLELQKKGKLPAAERYRRILKKKLAESRKQSMLKGGSGARFSLPGAINEPRAMSKRAEKALQEIAARKEAKEAKAQRRMVIVEQRIFSTGSVARNGKIFDPAGNVVAKINTKTGKMSTTLGTSLGMYKAKSHRTNAAILDAINKYSPYFINLRKMQAMQQGTIGGSPYGSGGDGGSDVAVYAPSGSGSAAPRQGASATAWGTRSNNVWGTSGDNVWGTSSSDVWGSGSGTVWGDGAEYVKKIGSFFAGLFGFGGH